MDDGFKYPSGEKKVKFKSNMLGSRKENSSWIIKVTALSFVLSASLLYLSTEILKDQSIYAGLFILITIISIGIIFDIIGIAVTVADEAPFHAMASRKYYGAKRAIKLIRKANKVSSICNDIIGDICGVLSGASSALIVIRLSATMTSVQTVILSLVLSGMVAAITVGGKAIGKSYAIGNGNYIIYKVSVLIQFAFSRTNSSKKKRT